MDTVELPFPVDVAPAPTLIAPEGLVRAGVTVKEVEGRGSDRVSIVANHSIYYCDPRLENDVANVKSDTEFRSGDGFPETELIKNSSMLPNLQCEEVSNGTHAKGKNCRVISSKHEGLPFQQKAGKVHRSVSSSSKRLRILEDSTDLKGIENSKESSDKHASNHIKCDSSEKSQVSKQKSNGSKRGDKKNIKVPSKAKFDSSSMKLGAAVFNSACGGNNFFGLYGLKHDIHDVTKPVEEPTLDELLKGTFDCPSLGKDKGKKTSNISDNFLSSVRKACSILHVLKSVQPQSMAEIDSSSSRKMSASESSSVCVVESGDNRDKEQSFATDMSICHKEPSSETETPVSPLDFPLYQPKDILERIALPQSRDLDSLLLDASKAVVTSKSNSDLRTVKHVSRRPSLTAFPWSHNFSGHCRTNSDAVRLSSRITCPGKWAKIGFVASFMGMDLGSFTNLDSFSYDQTLVPSVGSSDNKGFLPSCANIPFCHWVLSSSVTCSKGSQVTTDFEGQVDGKKYDGNCSKLLAAAQTLYEMATSSPTQNEGTSGWQKKASQKSTKARNWKSNEKSEEMISKSTSAIGSDQLTRSAGQMMPSKKPRLSIIKSKDGGPSNTVKKGPYAWPTSKSSRSLPNKSIREPIVENKHSNPGILKQHSMMPPPPTRVLDKAFDSQQKVRKVVLMDWKRQGTSQVDRAFSSTQ
ncbi:uncharacterized protein LOC129311832 [Prosopis cineraria]|uniref:uncharacterized protein LOC129311832 n=1 Tax=Prosopis cineraria TaxID=364024 RepID=UPI00240F6A92|nr:uncharacterized protein LOC129311832 [Prosopis cineraria]